MRQTPESIAFLVLDLLARLDVADRIQLLRLIAQDDRPAVAGAALQQLEQLAGRDALPPEAASHRARRWARSTHSNRCCPPTPLPRVERTLRKLQFAGHRYTPPPAAGWRALFSPADVAGNYTIWFVHAAESHADGVIMGMVLNQRLGIRQVFGAEDLPPEQIPQHQPIGQLVTVRTDAGVNAVLLEAPFDFGRPRLAAAQPPLDTRVAAVSPRRIPAYGDRLWGFAPPLVEPDLARCVDDATPPSPLPTLAELDNAAAEVLAHPAMQGWTFNNRIFLQARLWAVIRSRRRRARFGRGCPSTNWRTCISDRIGPEPRTGQLDRFVVRGVGRAGCLAVHRRESRHCPACPFAGPLYACAAARRQPDSDTFGGDRVATHTQQPHRFHLARSARPTPRRFTGHPSPLRRILTETPHVISSDRLLCPQPRRL